MLAPADDEEWRTEVWRCPRCGQGNLAPVDDPPSLACRECGGHYQVASGVPQFCPEALSEPSLEEDLGEMRDLVLRLRRETAELPPDHPQRFRLPHRRFGLARLLSEEREVQWLIRNLGDLSDAKVLNVSCGAGRDADILLRRAQDILLRRAQACTARLSARSYGRTSDASGGRSVSSLPAGVTV